MSQSGLTQVFLQNRPALARFLRARGLASEDADDLLQDVFVKLQTNQVGPVNEPLAYLYRMTRNLLLDQRRSTVRRVAREAEWQTGGEEIVTAVDDQPSAEQGMIANESLSGIKAALMTLPERTRDIFYRSRVDGQTQKSIAIDLGITKSAVEKHLYRAYALVHQARTELESDPSERNATLRDE
ncbi:MAG: sigma-70 family RNA polymerase sigma factor [Blastomonas fulva]|uniref:RNA polymerase sigma factor n=1 Tax=Blastomonas fulva TaxID=1550728 RepID=UPI0024E1CA76|nr:sigma-70 family RNA polymerase sigma factor [Blastomonas fulva]MDK2759664.1 sigma-70 family RNA polymerase sigma factor [Blastomonas fulva]